MQLTTAIFDMDGLLIDSEPLWNEAGDEVFKMYGINISEKEHAASAGLRTKEFVQWWFYQFNIGDEEHIKAERRITQLLMEKIARRGREMPGVQYIFDFFYKRNFRIGIASSSPNELIEMVIDMCGIKKFVSAATSAEHLPYGKPHPQVFLDCAEQLQSNPVECICFEDSFNGMIAAKAARMKCVVVPHRSQQKEERWSAADLKISSLQNFGELHLNLLT